MGNDGKVTEVPVPGKSLADVVPFGPAKAKRAATLTGRYLDEILEKAWNDRQKHYQTQDLQDEIQALHLHLIFRQTP